MNENVNEVFVVMIETNEGEFSADRYIWSVYSTQEAAQAVVDRLEATRGDNDPDFKAARIEPCIVYDSE